MGKTLGERNIFACIKTMSIKQCRELLQTIIAESVNVVLNSNSAILVKFKPSQRKQSFGIVLSDLCDKVGLPLKNSEYHSTKICNTCSRKILKVHELVLTELKSSVNTLHEKFQHHYQPKDVDASEKRKLLTPDRGANPFNRKSNRFCSPRGSPCSISRTESKSARKKCLFSSDTRDDLTGQSSGNSTGTANNVDVNTDSDDVLSKLNIDGLKTCEGRSSLKSKVLLVHPNGNIVT